MSTREQCLRAAGEAIAADLAAQAARTPEDAARHALYPGASPERVAEVAAKIRADRDQQYSEAA